MAKKLSNKQYYYTKRWVNKNGEVRERKYAKKSPTLIRRDGKTTKAWDAYIDKIVEDKIKEKKQQLGDNVKVVVDRAAVENNLKGQYHDWHKNHPNSTFTLAKAQALVAKDGLEKMIRNAGYSPEELAEDLSSQSGSEVLAKDVLDPDNWDNTTFLWLGEQYELSFDPQSGKW